MATTTIDVNRFNRGLLAALGLEGQLVRRIVLTADYDQFPTVEVTRLVAGPEADGLIETLEAYRLVEASAASAGNPGRSASDDGGLDRAGSADPVAGLVGGNRPSDPAAGFVPEPYAVGPRTPRRPQGYATGPVHQPRGVPICSSLGVRSEPIGTTLDL